MTQYEIRGEPDERAVQQLRTCAESGEAPFAALCADAHVGYSQPIGGVVAYRDYVSPSGVGYDIGCGNKAIETSLHYADVRLDLPGIMDEIFRRVSFGVGRKNNEQADDPVLDAISRHGDAPVADMASKAASQLGTVGSGNHYVDLFRHAENDRVWIGAHFGSRGFGHSVASGFLARAQGKRFDERAKEGEMMSPPVLLRADSDLGQSYVEAMKLAGAFAHAGRNAVCDKVLEILGAASLREVHNHHNYAWQEEHHGEKVWVHRKGATPAFPGQEGFVGATMGEPSYVVRGVRPPMTYCYQSQEDLLFSTVHGAGRVMSRTEAAGKLQNVAECNVRDCDQWVPWKQFRLKREFFSNEGDRPGELGHFTMCTKHPAVGMRKTRRRVRDGKVNWPETQFAIRAEGIELRGAGADEAPMAYKRLDEVLAFHADTIIVTDKLIPIGVAMASPDQFDPWKD